MLLPAVVTARPPLPSEEAYNDEVAAVDAVGEMVPVDELDLHDDFSQLMQCPITLVGSPSDWHVDCHIKLLAISKLHMNLLACRRSCRTLWCCWGTATPMNDMRLSIGS